MHEKWVQGHHTQTQGRHASNKQTRQHMGDEKKKTMSPHTDELETNTAMHASRHAYSWASQKTKSPRQRAKVT